MPKSLAAQKYISVKKKLKVWSVRVGYFPKKRTILHIVLTAFS